MSTAVVVAKMGAGTCRLEGSAVERQASIHASLRELGFRVQGLLKGMAPEVTDLLVTAPSVIEIDGRKYFRHSVHNHGEVLRPLQPRLDVVLQGHIHMREVLEYQTQIGEQRLITAAAVVGPPRGGANDYGPLSGITLHTVVDGHVDDGKFLPLDPGSGGR